MQILQGSGALLITPEQVIVTTPGAENKKDCDGGRQAPLRKQRGFAIMGNIQTTKECGRYAMDRSRRGNEKRRD